MKAVSQFVVSFCLYCSGIEAITRHARRENIYDHNTRHQREKADDSRVQLINHQNRMLVHVDSDGTNRGKPAHRQQQSGVLYYSDTPPHRYNERSSMEYEFTYDVIRREAIKLERCPNVGNSTAEKNEKVDKQIPMTVLGFFDLSQAEAESELSAVKLAIEDMNRLRLLGCDYYLNLSIHNSKGDAAVALYQFFNAVHEDRERHIKVIISTTNSKVTRALSKITHAWQIPLISSSYSASHLDHQKKFPMFFQTTASDSSHNGARIAFLNHFRWSSVITLCEQEELYISTINDLSSKLEEANISHEESIFFSRQDLRSHLQVLQISGIFGSDEDPELDNSVR